MKLVLIGMMGTGKSTIGKLLAAEIGAVFLDTDQLIETRTSRRITEIFREFGEAYFRKLEHELAIELSQNSEKQVIATGGGFALDLANIEAFRPQGLVVALTADAMTIYQRVKHDQTRPLLAVADPLIRIEELLQERAASYAQADIVIDTSKLELEAVVQQIMWLISERFSC